MSGDHLTVDVALTPDELAARPPSVCPTCPDELTHVRLASTSLCHEQADARLVLQMLGLVESPPAPKAARDVMGRARRRTRTTNTY